MTIMETLSQEIEGVLKKFNQNSSKKRLEQIKTIREILSHNNPVRAKEKLEKYTETVSTGFDAIWFFSEANQFKGALKKVLASSKYQEKVVLHGVLKENGLDATKDDFPLVTVNQEQESRFERLEKSLAEQGKNINSLEAQVTKLYSVNNRLMNSIVMLEEQNKTLLQENAYLKSSESSISLETNGFEKKYKELRRENAYLMQQVSQLTLENDQLTQNPSLSCGQVALKMSS